MEREIARGKVINAFGNLLHVEFCGDIRQGEIAKIHVDGLMLLAEVIEIAHDIAKVQVFEDTQGIKFGTEVEFCDHLLEAEFGPGLLGAIFDGLQNPLERVADAAGLFLNRGVYLPALDRQKHWDYRSTIQVKERVVPGDYLGHVMEGRFHHYIMVPFQLYGEFTITWVIKSGSYTIDTVVAKAIDDEGKEHEFTMVQKWPVKRPLCCGKKMKPAAVMDTGLRIIDTHFPLLKGGTFCSPGPFGAGKTVFQHHLSKYSSVDIVIVVACGERAGEVVEMLRTFPRLNDPFTGESLMMRTTIICNTSSMPVAAREASIYMGTAIGEYFRQMGLDVLLLADSTSRWAQAMREMSGRLEEIPGEEAFPAYLKSRIAAFYGRAGLIVLKDGNRGSLTIGGSISPAGGNIGDPVTVATLAVVGAFLCLSRERSDARRYPAIDPLISWSKYLDIAGEQIDIRYPGWSSKVRVAAHILKRGDEIGQQIEIVGEEGVALSELIVFLKAGLYDFCYLQQNAFNQEEEYFKPVRQIALFSLMSTVLERQFTLTNIDTARTFFNDLKSEIKNANFLPSESEQYASTMQCIETMIESHA